MERKNQTDIDKIIEKICPKDTPDDVKLDLELHLSNLVESSDILLSSSTPGKTCKFEPGDIVLHTRTNEIGYVVGILNSWPRFVTTVISESVSRDPRYLIIILNPEHSDFTTVWRDITKSSSLAAKPGCGYFSVRYPRQSQLSLVHRRDAKESEASEIKEFCSLHCIIDCDSTCPFYKHGHWKESSD